MVLSFDLGLVVLRRIQTQQEKEWSKTSQLLEIGKPAKHSLRESVALFLGSGLASSIALLKQRSHFLEAWLGGLGHMLEQGAEEPKQERQDNRVLHLGSIAALPF